MFEDISRRHSIQQFRFWYQPLDCLSSAKPDAYLSWNQQAFDLKELKGSKFQFNGGVLTVDQNSPPFIENQILWVPALIQATNGESLDLKTPLQKTAEKFQSMPTVEIEQSFYLIDAESNLGDLLDIGCCIYNFSESVGADELRISLWIHDVLEKTSSRGIEVEIKKIGNSQFVAKSKSETSVLGVDHHIQLMEILSEAGKRNKIVALFHEKPFPDQPYSEKKITWSANVSESVIQHALLEHEELIQEAIKCFNLDDQLTGLKTSIQCTQNKVEICGLSPAAHPALVICVLQAAVFDRMQLRKQSVPISSLSTSPFTDPRTQRAFGYSLSLSELLRLQELCFKKYATTLKSVIGSMVKLFDEKVLPLLLTQDLMKRSSIEQEIAGLQDLILQTESMGFEIQAKVLKELGIIKILKAKSTVEQFVDSFRI